MRSILLVLSAWLFFYYGSTYLLTPEYKVHKEGAILVTGASTGIGQDAAFALADLGFDVFASVRKQSDVENLIQLYKTRNAKNANKLHPLIMDVSTEEQIQTGFKEIESYLEKTNTSLVGIVNNAGLTASLPTEFSTWNWNARILNVNLLGAISVIQHSLPHLRKNEGRIVNIGSLAGLVSLGYDAAYTASKHGIEGVTDCLRRELYTKGVSVSLIEPGFIKTPIIDKASENSAEKLLGLTNDQLKAYQHFLDKRDLPKDSIKNAYGPESTTTPHIVHALTATRPSTRYQNGLAGPYPASFVPVLASIMPDRVMDALVYYF